MIASMALALLSVCAVRAGALDVAIEPGGRSETLSAPQAPPPSAVTTVLAKTLAPVEETDSMPPAFAASPDPLAEAAALDRGLSPSIAPAAQDSAPPDARRVLDQIASPEPRAAAAAIDGGGFAFAPDQAPVIARGDGRQGRLERASVAPSGVATEPAVPIPSPDDSGMFLYRHHGFTRAIVAPLLRLFYEIRVEGLEHLPPGPVLFVSNHVSRIDPILIHYAAHRPIRYLTYRGIYEARGLRRVLRSLAAIPISNKDPKDVTEASLRLLRHTIEAGGSGGLFPEGQMTLDGSMGVFHHHGIEVADRGITVVPVHISGMEGSLWSRLWTWRSLLVHAPRHVIIRLGPGMQSPDAGQAWHAVERLAPR